jgi:hypothetical protein
MSDMTGDVTNTTWNNNASWTIPMIAAQVGNFGPIWPSDPPALNPVGNYPVEPANAEWFRFTLCEEYDVKLIRVGCTPRRFIESNPSDWGNPVGTLTQGKCIDAYIALLNYVQNNHPTMKIIICPHDDDHGCQWVDNTGTAQALTATQIAQMWTYIATKFSGYSNVYFEIFNEPREWYGYPGNNVTQSGTEWYQICVASINAIRATGATNKILIPGVDYTGVHNWMTPIQGGDPTSNATLFENINSDVSINNLGDFAFSMHQYYDNQYIGKNVGVDATQSDFSIDNWFNVNTAGGTTNWLNQNNFKAILTETNIMQNNNDLIAATNTDYTTYFEVLTNLMIQSGVWLGMNGWSSVYNYNDNGGPGGALGQLLNSPSTNTWIQGWRTTAPWFAYKASEPAFNYRIQP